MGTKPPSLSAADTEDSGQEPMILLVEDSEELRVFLSDNLRNQYVIAEARNGQ